MTSAPWVLTVHQFGGSSTEAVIPAFVMVMPDEATAKAYEAAFNTHPKTQTPHARFAEVSAWAHPVDLVLPVGDDDGVDPAVLDTVFASKGVSWLVEEG